MYTINKDTITFETSTISIDLLRKALAEFDTQLATKDMFADAPVINEVKFTTSTKPGRMGVQTPYNAEFVSKLKSACPGAKFGTETKTWFFDEQCKSVVYALVNQYFAAPVSRKRIEFDLKYSSKAPAVDGNELIQFGRDSWCWNKKNCASMLVIEETLKTGGSVRNPDLSGKVVIELDIREGATITPEPVKVEVV